MPRSARLTERSVKIDFLAQSFAVALLPSYRPTLTRRLKIVLVLVVSVLVLDKWGCGAGVLEYLAKSELRLASRGWRLGIRYFYLVMAMAAAPRSAGNGEPDSGVRDPAQSIV